jgi:excisionase family DNA binding protein
MSEAKSLKEANWYTKKQVAELFGCSTKSVERWVKSDKLNPIFVTGKYGKQAMFDPEEVHQLKELEDSLGIDRAMTLGQAPSPVQTHTLTPALVTQAVDTVSTPLNALVAVTRENAAVPIHHKLFLTLREAQALSGLSRGHLKEAINEGSLKAQIIGRGWKVKRKDLEAFVEAY